jgi:hypothetical protein
MGPFDVFFDIIWDTFKKSKTVSSLLGLLSLGVGAGYLFLPIKTGHVLNYLNVIAISILLIPMFLIPRSAEEVLIKYIKNKSSKSVKMSSLSQGNISLISLIIATLIIGLMLLNISHLATIYPMNYLKWMAILEILWTIGLYLVCGIILLVEKVRG